MFPPKFVLAGNMWSSHQNKEAILKVRGRYFYMISPSHYLEGDIKNISVFVTNEIASLAVKVR